jgi:hypothetical protein
LTNMTILEAMKIVLIAANKQFSQEDEVGEEHEKLFKAILHLERWTHNLDLD